MKTRRILCLLLGLVLLTGCTASPAPRPLTTLVPSESAYTAPIGDAGLEHAATAALYLPSLDGQRLLTCYEDLTLTYSQHPAEAVVRTLLAHPGNVRTRPLSSGAALALYGSDPVTVSGGVCTVNLTPTALMLSQQDLYTVCQAITSTLCELEGITQVNILVADLAPSMDVAGYLPLGTITAQPEQELPVLYEQVTARRTPVGEKPSTMPLTAAATLYFPLEGGEGIVPEVRRLSFPGQHPQQLTLTLMDALSDGSELRTGVTALPDFTALMLSAPEVTDLNSGGQRVTLHFVPDIRQQITALGTDVSCCFAALVTTLTTFIPSLQQVCIRVGDGALTSLHSPVRGSLLFPGGLHTRTDYAAFLMSQSTLWHQEDGRLAAHVEALPYRRARDPRTLLLTLADAPQGHEVLPAGLTDADILGLSIQKDTLLIHLSARYAEAIRTSGLDQRRMAYAMVGVMCDSLPVRRVRFFFGNEVLSDLGGSVVWDGEFLHNPGLLPSTGGTP